ncbi:MAG: hypothetical protein QMB08_02830 [Acidimicrobiales bacterium]
MSTLLRKRCLSCMIGDPGSSLLSVLATFLGYLVKKSLSES